MSGSFVVAGSGAYRATKVGREAYAAKLADEASKFTLVNSELRSGINKILQFITYLLIPAGLLIIYTQLFTTDSGWRESVLRMVGALVPMVPEGLVLMTSIAFAVGVVRLGRRQCLVNELPAIEGLARVDVVCADKTGTLTENGMRLSDLKKLDERAVAEILAQLAADDARPNASMQAIAEAYKMPPGWQATATAPFKSATKWSGASYAEHGNWVIGAPDVLLEPGSEIAEQAEEIGAKGLRVLLLGSCDMAVDHADAPGRVTPAALVVLEQRVRPDARDTLDYFAEQKVSIKVISGDNAVSVGAVAGSLGLDGETMDARQLPDAARPAGRHPRGIHHVRPGAARPEARHGARPAVARTHGGDDRRRRQRRAGAQRRRHRCGDGLGQFGVAGGGSDRVAGQQVRDAAVCRRRGPPRDRQHRAGLEPVPHQDRVLGAAGDSRRPGGLSSKIFGTDPLLFPFQPIHVTIAAWFTIGIPAFVLSLAPNNERAHTGFVRRVMTAALPSGMVVGIATFTSYLVAYQGREATPVEQMQASTAALITLLVSGVWVLAVVARPYQWWRVALVAVSGLAYVVIFSIPLARKAFMLDPSNIKITSMALIIGLIGAAAIEVIWWVQGAILGERRRLWRSE